MVSLNGEKKKESKKKVKTITNRKQSFVLLIGKINE
jgi:hypothetical protein